MGEISKHPTALGSGLIAPAPLTGAHDLSHFNCGKPPLDDWLKNYALTSEGRTARTYVVCETSIVVVGYYCISMGSVERQALPSKIKRQQGLPIQVPVAIIGRLARHNDDALKGLGKDLLKDALLRVLSAAEIIGVRAVLVHSLDEDSSKFWLDNEFIECPVDSRTFYMAVETIADAL